MNDITSFLVVGRLTRDAGMKYTNSGSPMVSFSVASNYSKKQADSYESKVSFFDFVIFGNRASGLHRYLTKGQQVVVSGELRQERWDKDGEARSKVSFHVDDIQLVGGKGGPSKPRDPETVSNNVEDQRIDDAELF